MSGEESKTKELSNEELNKLREWSIEKGRPKGYILSVDPGWSRPPGGGVQKQYAGMANKLVRASYQGFDFAMLPVEETSELHEPQIKEQMEIVKRNTGLGFGLHLNVSMDLTLADAIQWSMWHKILVDSVKGSVDNLGPKWVLFHTSSNPRPQITAAAERAAAQMLFTPWGTNIGTFVSENGSIKVDTESYGQKISEKDYLKNWYISYYLKKLFSEQGRNADIDTIGYFRDKLRKGLGFEEASRLIPNAYKLLSKAQELEKNQNTLIGQQNQYKQLLDQKPEQRNEIQTRINEIQKKIDEGNADINKNKSEIRKALKEIFDTNNITDENEQKYVYKLVLIHENVYGHQRIDFPKVFDYWASHGSHAEEAVAYHIIAKWMWKTKDKMWNIVVGELGKNPFSDDFDPDKIVDKVDELGYTTSEMERMITAVAGKYLEGHLRVNTINYGVRYEEKITPAKNVTRINSYNDPSDPSKPFKDNYGNIVKTQSVYDYCKDNDVMIYIETNMPPQGKEGLLRVMSIIDHINICRGIDDGENLNYCMDTEHLTLNYLNPIEEAKLLKKWGEKHSNLDPNRYFSMFHMNAPRPQAGIHGTIRRLSMDPEILYNQLWWFRQAGIKNTYIIWERGSWGDPEDTAITYRALKDYLIQNIPPTALPKELFGIDRAFEALQNSAMKEHAFDMLKDLFMFAPQDHTGVGTRAQQLQKLDLWIRERYK